MRQQFIGWPLLVAAALTLSGCDSKGPEGKGAAAVEPAPVTIPLSSLGTAEFKSFSPEFSYPAVIEAVQKANARVDINARIGKIHFSAGDMVEEGDLLIEFDDSDYQIAVKSAQAAVEVAKAARVKAESNWKRARELKPKGHVSEQMYDEAQAAEASSIAEVARAEAALAQAESNLSQTRLHASFSGKISRPNYSIGEFFNGNSQTQPLPLFELVQLDPIYATGSDVISDDDLTLMAIRRDA